MRRFNVTRQLLLVFSVSAFVMVAVALVLSAMVVRAYTQASTLALKSLEQSDRSFALADRLNAVGDDLQQVLRLRDPDALEAALAKAQANDKALGDLVAATGDAQMGAALDAMRRSSKAVVDRVLLGDAGAAAERYLTETAPLREALNQQVHRQRAVVDAATRAEITAAQASAMAAVRWCGVGIGLAIAVCLGYQWRLKGRITARLLDMAGVLGAASHGIEAAADQVAASSQVTSEGAVAQAASLEQTSASLEEMSSMVRNSAEHSERAAALASETRRAAEAGSANVAEMSEAMAAIESSSNSIAKIIKTIDEIAFQTNILALNAAVEAARAGAAGQGFAVVADEVRNLAQRSAQAARETAECIEDSIRRGAHGAKVGERVAASLTDIVTKGRQMDSIAGQLATSSREQRTGIEQITAAVTHMDRSTQAGAASAEEGAAAAEELAGQAKVLNDTVEELLRLVGATATSRVPPARPADPAGDQAGDEHPMAA